MAAKTPKKFRQARKAARKDAKKVFSGKKQAGLKDKSPLVKYSADDQKALGEVSKEANSKYITDDKGNKIKTNNLTRAEGSKELKRTMEASNEAFRSKMRAEFGEYAGKKATQADYDSNPKFKERAPKAAPSKPEPKVTESGKVRSAVTATEPKPQSYKIDKDGKKIRPKGFKTVKTAGDVKKAAATETPKYKSVIGKNGKRTKTMGEVSKAVADKTKAPVVKKGFAAGKELNAEGRAIYDKLVKEGVKPKSALNKALFRQEKGAKVAAKAAAPIATAAKSAATAVKKQGPVKAPSTIGSMGTTRPEGLTPKVQKEIRAKAAATVKKAPVKKASTASKVGKVALEGAKIAATVAGPGKFLKAGSLIKGAIAGTKTAKIAKAASAAKPGTKVIAANKARKAANADIKAMSKGKRALRATGIGATLYGIGSLPVGGGEKRTVSRSTTTPPVTTNKQRSNQPRITGQGRFIGKGNIPTVGAGGSTTSYTIKKGDTLSGVAKTSGVKLSELLAANPKIADKKSKYKGGSMVWSGTKVKIPTKK
jgi:LysM repeat protein